MQNPRNRFLTIRYRDPIFVVYYFVAVSIRPISNRSNKDFPFAIIVNAIPRLRMILADRAIFLRGKRKGGGKRKKGR